jgi:hypothetical protein
MFAFLLCFVAGFLSELIDGLYQLAIEPSGTGDLSELFDVRIGNERLEGIEWIPVSLLGATSVAGCVLGLLVGIPVFAIILPVFMVLWTGILHLCLKVVGGLRQSTAGYQGTWATVSYATVAFLAEGIPVVGEWLAFFWLGLAQGIGFWRLHRTRRWRAGLALLQAARAWAFLNDRDHGLPEDLQTVLPWVVGHRLRSAENGAEFPADTLLAMFREVPVP